MSGVSADHSPSPDRRYRQFADTADDDEFRDALELTQVERVRIARSENCRSPSKQRPMCPSVAVGLVRHRLCSLWSAPVGQQVRCTALGARIRPDDMRQPRQLAFSGHHWSSACCDMTCDLSLNSRHTDWVAAKCQFRPCVGSLWQVMSRQCLAAQIDIRAMGI